MSYEKICIFRTGALGDVILTLPVIHNLHHAFPSAQINIIGNTRLLSLAQADHIQTLDIDRAIWAPLFASHTQFSQELTHQFQNTDLAISYLPDPDQILTKNLHRLGISQIMTHPPKPQLVIHAIDHLLAPLRDLNIPTPEIQPKIYLSETDHQDTVPYLPSSPTLLIHPGSGGKDKCWLPEHFASVADTLVRQTNCQIFISSGPADGDLAQKITHLMTEKSTLLPQLPLRQLAALMTTCTAYLGNDSGPSHLAAAVGLPAIVLFGPTDPQIWAPRGPSVHIIRSSNQKMSSISPNHVIKTIHPLLPNSC
ncbi:MAG: ADP-heptose:LPS heptosyltransferase [Candidatus Latescibacterota bacterium]|jgi:ADP-heptose:LPS heptosyltransferase